MIKQTFHVMSAGDYWACIPDYYDEIEVVFKYRTEPFDDDEMKFSKGKLKELCDADEIMTDKEMVERDKMWDDKCEEMCKEE